VSFLTGGSGSDTFTVSSFGQLDSIDGGGGAGVDMIVGADVDNTRWTVNNSYEGIMAVGGVDQYDFFGIENIQGGILSDTFDFGAAGQMNSVTGGGGSDTIIGSGDSDKFWQLRVNGSHQYQNDQGDKISDFSGITAIQGGVANDQFVFEDGVDFAGTIDGGSGTGMDTLDYSQFTMSVSVDLANGTATATTGISNMENFIGGLGVDKLTGADTGNTWNISGINSGNVNSFTFSSVENVSGGAMDDTFNVAATGNITGTIEGAAGDDTLNVVYGSGGRTLTFDGGTDSNTVNLSGSAPNQSSSYTLSDATPDSLVSIIGNQTVNMSNIAQVNDLITADSITITGSDSDNNIQIGTANITGTNPTSVSFENFIPINFSNKQNVSINGGGGTDSMSIVSNVGASGTLTLAAESIDSATFILSADALGLEGFGSIATVDQILRTNVNSLALTDITGSANILEANGLALSAANVGGELNLATASGDITSAAALSVGGNTVITGASGSSVYFTNTANNFAGELSFTTFNPSADSLNDVQFNNNVGVTLDTVNTDNLAVTANGNITDIPTATIQVSDSVQLDASGNNILLDGAVNDFGTVAASNVNEFNITDVNDIGLGAISATSVVVTAGGQIASAGSNIVADTAQLTAQNGVGDNGALQTAVNSLSVSNANSGDINISNSVDLTIASISNAAASANGGSVTVTGAETITQSGQINAGNNVSLTAGSTYDQQANIDATNNVTVTAENGAITMQDGTRTDSAGATITYTSPETVTVSSLDAVYGQGRVEVSSGQGNIISSRAPDLSQPNITGNYAVFDAPFGSLGEPGRPLVINVPGTVVINTFTSVAPIYIALPDTVIDTSRLLFDINEAIAEVGGNQRTEVDALAIIDPAVFTHVKNYSEDLYPVKLPPDQLLSEDEEQKKQGEDPDIFDAEPAK
jgi:hypothetical protein